MEVNRISQAISLAFGTVSSSEENLFFKFKIRNVKTPMFKCFGYVGKEDVFFFISRGV